ncbi:MAG: sigma-54 dependent transcriptional regulator [Spirochaetales bacterium]|nr:sigma-54 dependent transcriptional regulator [Spirochaetales bacterium]
MLNMDPRNVDSSIKLNVLIIDNEKRFTEELAELLQHLGYKSYMALSHEEGLSLLEKYPIELIIIDVCLPGTNGIDLLKDIKTSHPSLEIIVVSAYGDMDTVITALRAGAIDYLRKPFHHVDLRIAIERTQIYFQYTRKIRNLERKYNLISKRIESLVDYSFIGVSRQIQDVVKLALTAAKYPDTNVLVTGESGTGKEIIARIIHYAGERKAKMFCPVNSSAIDDSLAAEEFFGHKKGSFTGALADTKGFFEAADGGTLFLDEISNMSKHLQGKLLRVIENKKIFRIGENSPVSVDLRLISATNRDLELMVSNGPFRLDLFYRINTLCIHIPPLRERKDDIEPLLLYFIDHFAKMFNKPTPKVSSSTVRTLSSYDFPGNVRELKNMTERAMILNKGSTLIIDDFFVSPAKKSEGNSSFSNLNLKEHEIALIRQALQQCDCSISEAANLLGIHRMVLQRKMEKYSISITKKDS